MKSNGRKSTIPFIVSSLLSVAFILSTEAKAGTKAEIGKPAPDFKLKDIYGKTYTLSEFRGRIVVLEWMNQDCPIWRGKARELNATYKKLVVKKAKPNRPVKENVSTGVVWLCIDSTHYMTPERNRLFFAVNGISKPVLMDNDGKVGHAYGARTTPHCFVIDAKGTLVYDGAFDNERSRGRDDKPVNYVEAAVKAVLAGKPVAAPRTNPYGCSVKYKK